ncbi:MAG: SDR family NAD(P)-dependent oxidoreductase [Deltaproteobacteria bacterium]|nr:SDR family NAD(P)-dependent oxidoreductase [Deltaproteobacteria bacterium]
MKRPYADAADLNGKTAIVTGASPRSIGCDTARILASFGATVVITTRSSTDAAVENIRERLDTPEARTRIVGHSLDLSDRNSVERFAHWFLETHGDRLDILVNNAGVHLDLMSSTGASITWAPRTSPTCCFLCSKRPAGKPEMPASSTSSRICW